MLSKKEIEYNKNRFISELKLISREGADIEELINYLENESDFFTAPASTLYHSNYEGGLCAHSLNVFDELFNTVVKDFTIVSKEEDETCYKGNTLYATIYNNQPFNITSDTIRIVSLLHDISKTNFYDKTAINKKQYFPNGTKRDEIGTYDWVTEIGYKMKDKNQRFIFGTHGQNSEYIIGKFIPLTLEESAAIINHHAGMGEINNSVNMSEIMNEFPLVTLLHIADVKATFLYEKL